MSLPATKVSPPFGFVSFSVEVFIFLPGKPPHAPKEAVHLSLVISKLAYFILESLGAKRSVIGVLVFLGIESGNVVLITVKSVEPNLRVIPVTEKSVFLAVSVTVISFVVVGSRLPKETNAGETLIDMIEFEVGS